MSTGIVHQPDTPVSSGSPSSVGNSEGGDTSKLDCFQKNDDRLKLQEGARGSCCSSPPNEDNDCQSGSSSPASSTITPNLSFTPPANGILTPPNDSDLFTNDSLKSDRGAGRLKFYKDGVLCLELSHHDEGAKRKWVQIRTKTVFPTVVHTKKEVVIPRHVSPSPLSFHSPLSATTGLQQRLESSASHSTSDDGSSMLSSPRIRESSWRKPVPNKGISLRLEFYLKPARCVLKYRQHSKKFYESKRFRKPYSSTKSENNTSHDDNIPDSIFKCSCDILRSEKTETEMSDTVDGCSHTAKVETTLSDPLSLKQKKKLTPKSSILELVQKLHDENEKHLKLTSTNNKLFRMQEGNDKRSSATTDQPLLPKKRSFRDTEVKDPSLSLSSPSLRPAKVSPKSKSVKTILNIPGYNEFTKRSTTNPENSNEIDTKPSHFGPSSDNRIHDNGRNRHDPFPSKKKNSSSRASLQHKLEDYSTCSPSSVKIPRKSPSSPKHSPKNSSNFPSQSQSAMYLSSLPPEQQHIFQQQTMSKAISYTINSLLSSHNQEPSKNSPAVSKIINHQGKHQEKAKMFKRDNKSGSGSNQMLHQSNYFGIKGDHDQNSFLRHLLDTSDPIPGKPDPPTMTAAGSSSSSNNSNSKQPPPESEIQHQLHQQHKSLAYKDNSNSKSINRKLPRESKSGKEKLQQQQPGRSVPPPQQQQPLAPQFQHQLQQMGFYPPSAAAFLQHPSLFGAGFPLGHMQGYEALFGGQNPSVNALAAAAAELQYQSLLPPNFLSMNPQMAAAMAASYLGASHSAGGGYHPPTPHQLTATGVSSNNPKQPPASTSRSPPIPRGRSENYPSTNRQPSSKSIPLNLSQREQGSNARFNNGSIIPTSIPVPFHAPISDSQHSRIRSGSASSRSGSASSRGRLAKSTHDFVDDDVPLNLSKK